MRTVRFVKGLREEKLVKFLVLSIRMFSGVILFSLDMHPVRLQTTDGRGGPSEGPKGTDSAQH